MQLARSKPAVLLAVLASLLLAVVQAWALEPGPDGYYHTGDAVRVKTIAFIDIKVYSISHFIKKLPEHKSKQAIVEMDADKKLVWKMLRDVDAEKIQNALREAYAMNGYSDAGNIAKFTGAFTSELKEGARVTITYDSEKKVTNLTVQGGGTASVPGADFMQATWRIWFGKIDQPRMGDELIRAIP